MRHIKGFTLLELIITSAAVAIILPALFILSRDGMVISTRIMKNLKQGGAVEKTLFTITGDIHSASRIKDISSKNLVISVNGGNIEYIFSDGKLVREKDNVKRVILEGITSLIWSPDILPPKTRHIVMSIEVKNIPKKKFVTSFALKKRLEK